MHPGVESWKYLVKYAYNVFSIPLLLRTFFAPWKMDKDTADLDILEKTVFWLFSRFMGFIARLIFIVIGLIFTILAILSFPIFFLIPIKISREYFLNLPSFGSSLSYGSTFTLNAHSRDLADVSTHKLFGKEKALRMIERGLSKDTNHNVLLVGETGVGKSILMAHLGRLGESGFSFDGIKHHRVVELFLENLNLPDFDRCLSEAARAGNVILVLENIHAYEGVYERLMPYLNLKHLGIIATTDFANYDQVLKRHSEFLSRFEKVDILGTNTEDTISIVLNNAYASGVLIKKEIVAEIVRLTDRFVGNQPQPLKSLLVLEELQALKREITIEDVRQVISDKTNIPIGTIGADERKILTELAEAMKRKIVGQEEAVKDVSEALIRLRTGISDSNKPAGSFLFLGPTGVGKTYTAKILAESYFGRKNAMIRFDMSEFSLAESIPVFIDRLSAVIEEAPLSLVFFDELEKANPKIHNLLLQVLDEGRLTRESGREASFKDAIVIATSNAGSAQIIANPAVDKKVLLDTLIKAGTFAPEFLNRWSSIILFKPLNKEEVRKVASLLLQEFAARLMADKNITLEITEALIDKIASVGFDPDFGARPIKRAIEEIVENKVADYILKGNVGGILKII